MTWHEIIYTEIYIEIDNEDNFWGGMILLIQKLLHKWNIKVVAGYVLLDPGRSNDAVRCLCGQKQ